MKKIFLFPVLLLCVCMAQAQTGTYSGTVLEYGKNAPLEFVNVAVFDTAGRKLIGGTTTSSNGAFKLENLPINRPLQATFSAMGFASQTGKVFRINPNKPQINVGSVYMKTEAQLLEAVTISGQKRTIEYNLDKKVVNVEQSLVSEGGTAVDVLQNVPGISVNEEGAVSMKGSDNITILIDGRPASFTDMGLDQISAANIANIEIISNPSAKYNPEGTSGILNIITKGSKKIGMDGNITLSGSTANRHSVGANLSYGLKKATLFTNVDINYRKHEGENSSDRTSVLKNPYENGDNVQKEYEENQNEREGFGGKIQVGSDIRFDAKNTLLLSLTSETWHFKRTGFTPFGTTYSYYDPEAEMYRHNTLPDGLITNPIRSLTSKTVDHDVNWSVQGALSYLHKFDKPKQELSLDATVSYRWPFCDAYTDQWEFINGDTIHEEQTSTNPQQSANVDVQLNYNHPFNDKLALEVGYQGRMQQQSSESYYPERLSIYQDTFMSFGYIEHNHGVYTNLKGTFGKFTFQVGGRMEAALMDAKTLTERGDTSFSYFLPRFYPAVHLSYKLGKKQELQLSYSRRVNRPRPRQLDPYIDYSDYPSSISYGNPSLKPQDIHSLEFNYSLFLKSASFYVTVYDRYMTDLHYRHQFQTTEPNGNLLLTRTFRNYAQANTYGVDVAYEQQLLKWWRMGLNASVFQTTLSDKNLSEEELEAGSGMSYSANFNTTMNLPLDFVLQLSCRYRGPSYWGQTRFDQNISAELAVRKSFLKKTLNLNLRVSDLFHTMQWNNTVTGDGFTTYRIRRPKNSTALYVTLTYKINKGVENRRKEKRPSNTGSDGGEMDGGE